MVRPHSASVLLAWGAAVIALQAMTLVGLCWAALALAPLPILFARRRGLALLHRTRWLLLSIALMFALATPGQRLPGVVGDFGVTVDGLVMASEHLLRLVLLLATLALLHERLGTRGMVAGFHALLAPLALWRDLRDRIVVRLMLVIDYADSADVNWRDWLSSAPALPATLDLPIAPARPIDWAIFGLLGALALAGLWPS